MTVKRDGIDLYTHKVESFHPTFIIIIIIVVVITKYRKYAKHPIQLSPFLLHTIQSTELYGLQTNLLYMCGYDVYMLGHLNIAATKAVFTKRKFFPPTMNKIPF